ncbi:MAG: c-type cytochrome [Verrucomicrobia bacterium]|nr:c-type cytochrome [Verrucomicrobiota bacterium]
MAGLFLPAFRGRRGAVIAVLAFALAPSLHAEPLIVAFDRFHAAQPTAEGGRLLYNELGCANCHGGDTGIPTRRGPVLTDVTARVQPDWLKKFLANPAAARAGTTMPHVLPANDPQAVEAVAHYLGSLRKAPISKKQIRVVNFERGRELFHTIGCVACHEPDAEFQPPEGKPAATDFTHRSVAHAKLDEKYALTSLADFLRDPLKVRPDARMPRFTLAEEDVADLAAYLLNFKESYGVNAPGLKAFKVDPALAARGRALVTAARCAACHDLPKDVAAKTMPLKGGSGGCLENSSVPGLPRYELSAPQQDALKLFLAQRNQPATPAQVATLTLEALNCMACHDRNGRGGPDLVRKAYFQGDHNLGDTGRYPPPLTDVGRKLRPAWLPKVLTGEARVRPYLKTQMPLYGAATTNLPALLAKVDVKERKPLPPGDVEAGRKLLGAAGGLSCITCHRWGARPSLGIQGFDLSNLYQRIQPTWLQEYLINPAGYRAGTLMPSFWPEGKAANMEILGGDTARQIAAIYEFAKSGKGEPEGYPATASGQFELVPKEHPIVQRTFMEGVGTHTILVGFPEGVHLAYDGEHARPVLAWRGKFFDAYSTWFSRFAPFEKPLGESVVKWPAASPGDPPVRFEGYRLDAKRVPTFLFTVEGVRVEERFEPAENGLRRSLKWDAAKLKDLSIAHPDGVTVAEDSGSAPGKRSFTYVWK